MDVAVKEADPDSNPHEEAAVLLHVLGELADAGDSWAEIEDIPLLFGPGQD